jgi:hypothetical protein
MSSASTLRGWDIDETDFGGSLILHHHADMAVPAYVIDEVGNWRIAECSECNELLEFAAVASEPSDY